MRTGVKRLEPGGARRLAVLVDGYRAVADGDDLCHSYFWLVLAVSGGRSQPAVCPWLLRLAATGSSPVADSSNRLLVSLLRSRVPGARARTGPVAEPRVRVRPQRLGRKPEPAGTQRTRMFAIPEYAIFLA